MSTVVILLYDAEAYISGYVTNIAAFLNVAKFCDVRADNVIKLLCL